ncbi:MAG: TIGR02996 domain-containing protein [Planctomycetota bacterium]
MSQQSLPDSVPPRRFEYADDRSYKFWTIALSGLSLTTRFGKIGHPGQTKEIRFDSAEDAKRNYLKRIRQKTRAGYEERVPNKTKVVSSQETWHQFADHEPFLKAILESPDDQTGYAIYADWLSEQQDPRGEFIRIQLALEDPSLPLYKRPKLERSADLIRQDNVRAWLGNLAPWLMDRGAAACPYQFRRGQLAVLICVALRCRFAHELKASPHCRFLEELSIGETEILGETIQIDDQRYEAGQDYGLRPLLGGDFGNVREFRFGTLPEPLDSVMPSNTSGLIELIASMPRLERLWLWTNVDLRILLELPLKQLRELHVLLDVPQIERLSKSGRLPQLSVLGSLNPITNGTIAALIRAHGFDQLTQFICHELSSASESSVARMQETGVLLELMNFPD